MAAAVARIMKVWLLAVAFAVPTLAASSSRAKSAAPPLKGRVATLTAEVESLTSRVKTMLETVGAGGTPAAAAALELEGVLGKEAPYARYTALLHSGKMDEGSLKEDIAALETKVSDLKSKLLLLEKQVVGSLLQKSSSTGAGSDPTTLSSRVVALEKDVGDMRTRVTSLEQTVAGLQTKSVTGAAGNAMLQSSSSGKEPTADKPRMAASLLNFNATSSQKTSEKMKGMPLKTRVTALETSATALKERVTTLEGEVGMPGATEAAAELLHTHSRVEDAAFPEEDVQQFPELTETGRKEMELSLVAASGSVMTKSLKSQVAALEADIANVDSRLSGLENQVSGKKVTSSASLLEVPGSSLKGRIVSLEDKADECRTRATALEHVVRG